MIAQSLLGGWRRAAPVTFGPLIADVPIAFTLVFVMNQIPVDFLRFVRFAGAALLLFLARGVWNEIQARSSSQEQISDQPPSPLRGLIQGVLMIFMSPGPYLFWGLVLGPILLEALSLSLFHAIAFLVGFYVLSIGMLQLMAFIIGRIGELSERGRKVMQFASLGLMLMFAIVLFNSGLRV